MDVVRAGLTVAIRGTYVDCCLEGNEGEPDGLGESNASEETVCAYDSGKEGLVDLDQLKIVTGCNLLLISGGNDFEESARATNSSESDNDLAGINVIEDLGGIGGCGEIGGDGTGEGSNDPLQASGDLLKASRYIVSMQPRHKGIFQTYNTGGDDREGIETSNQSVEVTGSGGNSGDVTDDLILVEVSLNGGDESCSDAEDGSEDGREFHVGKSAESSS